MKHLVILASLVCALSSQTAVAGRAPTAQTLLTIELKSEMAEPTKTVQLWSTGAYTVTSRDATGAVVSTVRAGISNKQMAAVRTALQNAAWTVTLSDVRCTMYSPSYTQYFVKGTLMYTAQLCSGASVDGVTAQSIATIESLLPVR
jgi:hypothetical protein